MGLAVVGEEVYFYKFQLQANTFAARCRDYFLLIHRGFFFSSAYVNLTFTSSMEAPSTLQETRDASALTLLLLLPFIARPLAPSHATFSPTESVCLSIYLPLAHPPQRSAHFLRETLNYANGFHSDTALLPDSFRDQLQEWRGAGMAKLVSVAKGKTSVRPTGADRMHLLAGREGCTRTSGEDFLLKT